MTTAATTGSTAPVEISHPSDTETLVRRRFPYPPGLVFRAWTDPDLVRAWWASQGAMSVCDIDLRPGGTWRWAYRTPDRDVEVAFSGTYRRIEEPSALSFSERFEMMPGSEYETAITFDPHEGGTLVTERMTYSSKELRDGHRAHAFDEGITEAFVNIEKVLERVTSKGNAWKPTA